MSVSLRGQSRDRADDEPDVGVRPKRAGVMERDMNYVRDKENSEPSVSIYLDEYRRKQQQESNTVNIEHAQSIIMKWVDPDVRGALYFGDFRPIGCPHARGLETEAVSNWIFFEEQEAIRE